MSCIAISVSDTNALKYLLYTQDTLLLSGNDGLNGDASKYCQSSSLSDLLLFETDCTPVVEELSPAPVQCSCCTSCK
jgi:hypothetical protein